MCAARRLQSPALKEAWGPAGAAAHEHATCELMAM
jgi:hypothetical protein